MHVAPSIAAHQVKDPHFFGTPVTTTNYISELDVIREALFVLAGLPTEMFELEADGLTFKPRMIACLTHLSVELLESILTQFGKWGTIVRKLSSFVKKIQDDTKTDNLFQPCLHAISTVVCETLADFQLWVVEMQYYYFNESQILKEGEEKEAASVLILMDRSSERLVPLMQLYIVIGEAAKHKRGEREGESEFSPTRFVNTMYSRIVLEHQASGNVVLFRWGVGVFAKVLKPWFDAVERWWLDGSIVGSGVGICCNDSIEIKSSDFWSSKFTFDKTLVPEILQSCYGTVMSIGKCLAMLQELNPELIIDIIPELRSGILANILEKFSELMQIESLPADTAEESVVTPSTLEEVSAGHDGAATSFSNLLLFERVWQPENAGDSLAPILGANNHEEQHQNAKTTRSKEEKWFDSLQKQEFSEHQIWRPFQETFQRAIAYTLEPKFQKIGSTLTRQFLGPKCRLLSHLRTLQQVFLMTSGLVMGPMLDEIAEKMRSGELWRRPGTLQAVFDASVASSETSDEYSRQWVSEPDCVLLIVDEISITQDMRKRKAGGGRIHVGSLNCVKIGYDVSWPLNCIISGTSLNLYNKALVFLMQLSLARNRLDKETLSFDKKCHGSKFGWMRQRTVLRRKMKVFVEGLTSFAMTTVIQPAVDDFMKEVVNFHDVDQLNAFHEAFLTDICDHFFLLNEKAAAVLNSIYKCLDLCIKFSDMCMRLDSNLELISAGKSTVSTPAQSPSTTPTKPSTPPFGFPNRPSSQLGVCSSSPHSQTTSSFRSRAASGGNLTSIQSSPTGQSKPAGRASPSGTRKVSSRPPSPVISQMKRTESFELGKRSISPVQQPSLNALSHRAKIAGIEKDRVETETEEEGIKFGNAVSGVYKSFVEVEEFVVNSCTSMASHGMPKLAGLAVFLKC
ncbi:UNVERIFIED_CONTAM: Gamma-tubulin complex component 5 [Siphonaria sp. JEL0065]|nr:Gamma-tubulin complex component 5 [Siphonaria sp. JEL0065]